MHVDESKCNNHEEHGDTTLVFSKKFVFYLLKHFFEPIYLNQNCNKF